MSDASLRVSETVNSLSPMNQADHAASIKTRRFRGPTCDFIISTDHDFKIFVRNVVPHIIVILFARHCTLHGVLSERRRVQRLGKCTCINWHVRATASVWFCYLLQLLAFCMIVTTVEYKFNNEVFPRSSCVKILDKNGCPSPKDQFFRTLI